MGAADRVLLADSLLMAHSGLVGRDGNFSRAAWEVAATRDTAAASDRVGIARELQVAAADGSMGVESRNRYPGKAEQRVRHSRRAGSCLVLEAFWQRFEEAIARLRSNTMTQDFSCGTDDEL